MDNIKRKMFLQMYNTEKIIKKSRIIRDKVDTEKNIVSDVRLHISFYKIPEISTIFKWVSRTKKNTL